MRNKTTEELIEIAAKPKAREVIQWNIFAIAAKCSDAHDKAYPQWADDQRRRYALECQAFILAEILRLLDGFKIEYFQSNEELLGTLYHFNPHEFWEEFDIKGKQYSDGKIDNDIIEEMIDENCDRLLEE